MKNFQYGVCIRLPVALINIGLKCPNAASIMSIVPNSLIVG